ncbi:hypothetical protein N7532_000112 [Penicillium argentinense]|uniref:Uncharacterized protein n=1 Tax=Penicillium argentinense TaxID=1131581 RepID=A0A9W9KNJ2_9EURO|nr:uncharacterized protein N7532_000112 [Penicillium argentinense]KAJ5112067.1 hypothetical protein N7532_000112 [Penicillium argentinense]
MQSVQFDDFESLPPAVRRKFFSNVERLRIRLAQSDPSSPACSTSNYGGHHVIRSGPGPLARVRTPSTALTRRSGLEKSRAPQKLRKPGSLQLAALVAQADSQCFHSLPAKVQQKLFSPEERRRLRQAYRDSVIYDAADQAFYRGNQNQRHCHHPATRRPQTQPRPRRRSIDSLPSDKTLPVAQPSTVFYDSDSESEWEETNSTMDQSIYDSFRWLDEDGDLDLSLDEYHSHIAAATSKGRSRRRPSFRRSLSFSTHASMKHRPSPSMPTRALPSSQTIQPLSPIPPLSPVSSHHRRRSSSRPASRRQPASHAAKSSTSSIDPSAQYYQDPDARLKLRVYLASPQKFDEAIEFGFPSLDQNKENVDPEPTSPSVPVKQECAGTFFEDDDGTVVGSPGTSITEEPTPPPSSAPAPASAPATAGPAHPRHSSQLREITRPSADTPSLFQRRQSFLPGSKTGPRQLPGNREMTLKMTLTRPDLREESPTPSQQSPPDDPLRLAALPPADRSQQIWDDLDDERGMVKKIWRRLRRRV